MTSVGYLKKVNVSIDGVDWKEVPAESPTLNKNVVMQENTDLSNTTGFKSRLQGLKDFNLGLEGNFSPGLTYQFNIKKSGTSTGMIDETMSNIVGNTFKIDDADKEIFDREVTPTFEDNGVPVDAADIESIDFLVGTVTFTAARTEPVTVTGNFIPVTATVCVNQGSLDMNIELEEDTNIKSATNGWKTRVPKLKDVSMSLTAFNDLNKDFFGHIDNADIILAEITLGTVDPQIIRGWFIVESDNDTGGVADVETEEISLQLDGDALSSFTWIYPTSGFNEALRILTDFFFNEGDLHAQILPENDIAKGFEGQVVMESFSLTLDINGKVTFSSSLQGNGALVDAT